MCQVICQLNGHSFHRVEVLTGTPRRRRWSDEEKAAIVAESQALGVQASEIALRYGLHRTSSMGGGGSSDRLPLRWPGRARTDPISFRWWQMAVQAREPVAEQGHLIGERHLVEGQVIGMDVHVPEAGHQVPAFEIDHP